MISRKRKQSKVEKNKVKMKTKINKKINNNDFYNRRKLK
jgi:hypothetical protein